MLAMVLISTVYIHDKKLLHTTGTRISTCIEYGEGGVPIICI
jgi:hypothetical protein